MDKLSDYSRIGEPDLLWKLASKPKRNAFASINRKDEFYIKMIMRKISHNNYAIIKDFNYRMLYFAMRLTIDTYVVGDSQIRVPLNYPYVFIAKDRKTDNLSFIGTRSTKAVNNKIAFQIARPKDDTRPLIWYTGSYSISKRKQQRNEMRKKAEKRNLIDLKRKEIISRRC